MREIAAVGQRAAIHHIINADHPRRVRVVRGGSIRHIQALFIRRECQPVGFDHVIDHQRGFAGCRIMAKNVAAVQVRVAFVPLFRARQNAIRRVCKPDRPIRFDDHIVRRIELLALVIVHHRHDAAVRLCADDAPPAMFAGNQAALQIKRVAVGVIRGLAKNLDTAVAFVPAHHPVVGDIAPHHIPRRHIHRPFRPDAAIRQLLQPRIRLQQCPKPIIKNFKLFRHELIFSVQKSIILNTSDCTGFCILHQSPAPAAQKENICTPPAYPSGVH